MTTTAGTPGVLPTLYADPLPEALAPRFVEQAHRVQRSTFGGGGLALVYRLIGVRGEWRLAPVGYYESTKHKGRKGPYVVTECTRQDGRLPGPDLEPQTFPSEADAWAWVTAEHRRRVAADLPAVLAAQLATEEAAEQDLRNKLSLRHDRVLAYRIALAVARTVAAP